MVCAETGKKVIEADIKRGNAAIRKGFFKKSGRQIYQLLTTRALKQAQPSTSIQV